MTVSKLTAASPLFLIIVCSNSVSSYLSSFFIFLSLLPYISFVLRICAAIFALKSHIYRDFPEFPLAWPKATGILEVAVLML